MLKNYLKVAWRNLQKHKAHSVINIAGLSVGMAVAMLIGLWIFDELSFDKDNSDADRVAEVWQHSVGGGHIRTGNSTPLPFSDYLRANFGSDFKYVVRSFWTQDHFIQAGGKKVTTDGNYFQGPAPDLFQLRMTKGRRIPMTDPSAMLVSASVAKSIFGDTDPTGKVVRVDDQYDSKISGVYADFPVNSSFYRLGFIAPWAQLEIISPWIKSIDNLWENNSFQTYVRIADHSTMAAVSSKIKDIRFHHVNETGRRGKPTNFLFPMSRWHLHGEFQEGVNTGGAVEYVWLFGIIGAFVLLLACINFMNLSTARSQKRAREVGVRKAVGSMRAQLIAQFYMESLLMSLLAVFFALLFVQLALPWFNTISGKGLHLPGTQPFFWIATLGFALFTALLAGSYPALYLSSFDPVKVLKGTFRLNRFAALPRQGLVVLQFAVSVTLVIGTIVIYQQIQFAKNRPTEYDRTGLVMASLKTMAIHANFDVLRQELLQKNLITEMSESTSPVTAVYSTNDGFNWEGKDPNLSLEFANTAITYGYGKTIGWKIIDGRDFSPEYPTDTAAFIVNEAAAKFTGLKHPVGQIMRWDDRPYRIIGVVKDMVVESPYEQPRPNVYRIDPTPSVVMLRLNVHKPTHEAMAAIAAAFNRFSPAEPFAFRFANEEYALKFGFEENVGTLAAVFAGLAIFISCLGLFGMASFTAEQRVKEIGVRKVLGASVANLWRLLSSEFVRLVLLSLAISIPVSWYFMHEWLDRYNYHTAIPGWIFIVAGAGAIGITLATVSYQAIKAALANPVTSLRSE